MRILTTELTFLFAHVRNQNKKKVKTLIIIKTHKIKVNKKTQNECK